MTTSRRDFLIGAGAAVSLTGIPSARADGSADAAVQALLAECAEELLADYPENATSLGIDTGPRAGLKARLTDRSAAGQQVIAARAARRLARLKAVDPATLSEATRIDLDVVRTAHEFASEGFAFPYGDVAVLNQNWSWRNAPYVVAQNTGAFLEIPTLLEEQHTIESRADADAYLARLEAYAGQIDGETERLRSAAAQGVIAPDFILDKTIHQLRLARGGNVAEWSLVRSLAKKTQGIPGDYAARAERIATQKIAPALERQLAELEAHRRRATSDAGVWKLPRGDEYYAWTLRAATTTNMTPDEIHERGREELRELHAEMDAILKRQGYTRGTVGERMIALGKEERFRFPEGDEGRRWPITKPFPAMPGRASTRSSFRSSGPCSRSMLSLKAGRCTPSSSPTSSASTKSIRSAAWDTCSPSHFAPAGSSSTPDCMRGAGHANRRSGGSSRPTAPESTK